MKICSIPFCTKPKRVREKHDATNQPSMCDEHDREYERARKSSPSTLALKLVRARHAVRVLLGDDDEA